MHHAHDLGVARIDGAAGGADDERRFTVDRAGEDGAAGSFRHAVGFAGEVRFVHHAVAFEDFAIDGADFVREHDELVAGDDRIKRDFFELRIHPAMGGQRHTLGEGAEHTGGASDGVAFDGFAAGEHEDDERAGEVFAEEDRSDDRNAGEQVGTELAAEGFDRQLDDDRDAAEGQGNVERPVGGGFSWRMWRSAGSDTQRSR